MPITQLTKVGDDLLPELPPGWDVSVDTEGSGLYKDGEPFKSGNNPPQPEARISVVSVSFRQPVTRYDAHGNIKSVEPGELLDFAWPFDQGPVLGKPGKPTEDPDTGHAVFGVIDQAEQDRILVAMSKVLGYEVTPELAMPNLPATDYANLIAWLDRRDSLTMHNSIHDMPEFAAGLRAGAGGNPDIWDGWGAWDPDSEPGTWELNKPQRLHMMEPTLEPLINPAVRRRQIWCTMVIQKQLIDPIEPAALKKTAKRLWGEDEGTEAEELKLELAKIGVKMTKRYDLLPWCGAMGRYAAKDTNLTYRLKDYQVGSAEAGETLPGFWELLRTEMELRTTLYRMERRGVEYAVEDSLAEGAKLRDRHHRLSYTMPFDPSKVMQAKRFYFGPVCPEASQIEMPSPEDGDPWAERVTYPTSCSASCSGCNGKNGMGLEPTERTEKTGQPKLDIPELRKLVAENRPWAKEMMQWTKMRNSDSKWYTGWAMRTGKDGRIRTRYKQTKSDFDRATDAAGGTVSGRLAVGRWQAQAIPHGGLIPEDTVPVRKLIGPRPGSGRFQAEHDLATGEMRVVTIIANSTKLWDALDAGADLHAMNAMALFGVDKDHPRFYDLRNAAKRGTFGILYGGGVYALMTQIEAASGIPISMADTKAAIASFFKTYPEFKRLTDQATHKVTRWEGGCGYLTMLDGWRRVYGLSEKTNSAVNQIIQGNLARAMIYWMLEIERQLPGVLLLQIHDSLVTEHTDDEKGHKEAQLVSEIGQKCFEQYFSVRKRHMNWGISPDRWDEKG
jgi:DNA polymerase I-like protein with 3'-5' exonuclease and polymerase domains